MIKILITGTALSLLLSGCLMIGKQEFSCGNGEELKDAGVCKPSMYILKNKDNMKVESYSHMETKEEKVTEKW